jgi:Uma2 family endonuclease
MDDMNASTFRHLRPVRPLRFPTTEPEDERLPQSRRHHHLCQALYEILRAVVSPSENTIGADQFVYFNANRPQRCLAPDVFVKLGVRDEDFNSWKTWKKGAPELAFEVLSPSDSYERWTLDEKIERYHELGVRELVVFNVDAEPGNRLRVWDRIEGDFVERVVEAERTSCAVLGVQLVVASITVVQEGVSYPACLRIARDEAARDLVRTREEARRDAEEGRRDAEQRRRAEEEARKEAEARVAALEAELARFRER